MQNPFQIWHFNELRGFFIFNKSIVDLILNQTKRVLFAGDVIPKTPLDSASILCDVLHEITALMTCGAANPQINLRINAVSSQHVYKTIGH